jgi:hypothetical protein
LMLAALFCCAAIRGTAAQQLNDASFSPAVTRPAYSETHPRVLIDAAHRNYFTASTNRLEPFARLLNSDGYDARIGRSPFNRISLDSVAVVVITTAQGNATDTSSESAFTEDEIATLKNWILRGGALLLASDHFPFDAAASKLITALGATAGEGYVRDNLRSYQAADVPPASLTGWLVFSRQNGLFGEHPILRGRDSSEIINKVVTFGGSSVTAPKNGKALLILSPSATNNARGSAPPRTLAKQQAAAFILGQGRVVLLGDATMLTAQRVKTGDYSFKLGMARPDNDDKQFALNVVHWLSGLLDRVVNLPADPGIDEAKVIRAVESGNGAAWGTALAALGRGSSRFISLLPKLSAEVRSSDPERRRRAIMAISAIGVVGNPWSLAVASALGDSSPAVRYEALLATAKVDPGNESTLTTLIQLAADTTRSAFEARRTIGDIARRTKLNLSDRLHRTVREMLRSPSALQRRAGLWTADALRAPWAIDEARRMLRDPAPSVRVDAVYQLDASARADLERVAKEDTATAVREAANEVLSNLGQPSRLPGLCGNHRWVGGDIPTDFIVEPNSLSLKADDAGPYRNGESDVRSYHSYAYNLLLPYSDAPGVPSIKPAADRSLRSRYLKFDLSSPVPNGGGRPLGVVVDSGATFHTFFMIDDTNQIWNTRDLPIGASVLSDRAEITLHVNGKSYSIQFGPWALGQCREQYSNGSVLHGEGTTPVQIERLSATDYRITAPKGSMGRLWERGDLSEIRNRGLYYFSFSVALRGLSNGSPGK